MLVKSKPNGSSGPKFRSPCMTHGSFLPKNTSRRDVGQKKKVDFEQNWETVVTESY